MHTLKIDLSKNRFNHLDLSPKESLGTKSSKIDNNTSGKNMEEEM